MEINFNHKKNFILIFLILVLVNGSIFFNIPILRQIMVFIFLTFIPGFLFLKTIKMDGISNIEYFFYSIGISISFAMFFGFMLNNTFYLGIKQPLTELNFLIMANLLFIILSITSFRNNNYPTFNINLKYFTNPKLLILILVPFLAIFGTYLTNLYEIRILLYVLIIILAMMPILVAFNKISKDLYPVLILSISVSLILHWALISNYIIGADIQYEYFFSNLVYQSSFWNSNMASGNVNAMLSIVIFAPLYSKLMNLNLIWILKIVFPLIYSLVPLGLYYIFESQVHDRKISFFSVFYFMSIFPFFSELLQLGRQELAEFIFVLLIWLLVTKKMRTMKGSLLIIIFCFGMVVSHYGLSYVYMLMLLFVMGVIPVLKHIFSKIPAQSILGGLNELSNKLVGFNFVAFFIALAIAWYIFVTSAGGFATIIGIGSNIYNNLFSGFLQPASSQGLVLIVAKHQTMLQTIYKYFYLISQLSIFIGISVILVNKKEREDYNFNGEYLSFTIASLMILAMAIVLPFFASSFNTTRLFHVCLFFLGPFCVIGLLEFFKISNMLLIKYKNKTREFHFKNIRSLSFKLFSVFLMIFLLFNTGFFIEISNSFGTDIPKFSIALGDASAENPIYSQKDINSAKWIRDNAQQLIVADVQGSIIFAGFSMKSGIISLNDFNVNNNELFYFYLREVNLKENYVFSFVRIGTATPTTIKTPLIDLPFYNSTQKIYDNGGSEILYKDWY